MGPAGLHAVGNDSPERGTSKCCVSACVTTACCQSVLESVTALRPVANWLERRGWTQGSGAIAGTIPQHRQTNRTSGKRNPA